MKTPDCSRTEAAVRNRLTLPLRSIPASLPLRLWLTLLLLGSLPTADLWAQASLDSPGRAPSKAASA